MSQGKGDTPRPASISLAAWAHNYAVTFPQQPQPNVENVPRETGTVALCKSEQRGV